MYRTAQILMEHAPKAFGLMEYLMAEFIEHLQSIIQEKEIEAIKVGAQNAKMYEALAYLANYLIENYLDFIQDGRENKTYTEVAVELIESLESKITDLMVVE